jgi:hypothetical protein
MLKVEGTKINLVTTEVWLKGRITILTESQKIQNRTRRTNLKAIEKPEGILFKSKQPPKT